MNARALIGLIFVTFLTATAILKCSVDGSTHYGPLDLGRSHGEAEQLATLDGVSPEEAEAKRLAAEELAEAAQGQRWGLRLTVVDPAAGTAPSPWPSKQMWINLVTDPEFVVDDWPGATDAHGQYQWGPLTQSDFRGEKDPGREVRLRIATRERGRGTAHAVVASLASLRRQVEEAAVAGQQPDKQGVLWIDRTVELEWPPALTVRTVTSDGLGLSGHPTPDFIFGAEEFHPLCNPWLLSPGVAVTGARFRARLWGAFELDETYEAPEGTQAGSTVDFVIPDASVVQGTAVDRAGRALAGVHLVLAANKTGPNFSFYALSEDGSLLVDQEQLRKRGTHHASMLIARSDDVGRFAFAGLKSGQEYYLFWGVGENRWQRRERPIRRGDAALRVDITRSGFATEIVEERDGERWAVPFADVVVKQAEPSAGTRYAPAELSVVGSETLARPGDRYEIEVSAVGFLTKSVPYTVTPGDVTTVTIVLERAEQPPMLRATFVDEDGKPLHKIGLGLSSWVEAPFVPGSWQAYDAPYQRTGNGVEIGPLPVGKLLVEAYELAGAGSQRGIGFRHAKPRTLTVPERGALEEQFVMKLGGRLRTRFTIPVRDDAGKSGRGEFVRVRLVSAGGQASPDSLGDKEQTPDPWGGSNGEYFSVLDGEEATSAVLTPGTYTLIVWSGHPRHAKGVIHEEIVEIKPGKLESVEVDLEHARPATGQGVGAASCGAESSCG